VRELVDDHVHGMASTRLAVFPRQDYRTTLPGLARSLEQVFVHHSVFVNLAARNQKAARIHHDFHPAFVQRGIELHDGQGRLDGDGKPDVVGYFKPMRTAECLAGQQPRGACAQGFVLLRRKARQKRQAVNRPPPGPGRDKGKFAHYAPSAGAFAGKPPEHSW